MAQEQPSGGPGERMAAAYNRTGQSLFPLLAERSGNVVLSPYSIGTTMAMALAGARGATAAEMARVLGLEEAGERVNEANAALQHKLNADSPKPFELRIANALMLMGRGQVSASYGEALRRDYAAEIFRNADLARINGWVRDKTRGKIDAILDSLPDASALVLLDAIYFKAPWQKAFDPAITTNEPFHRRAGAISVPTMHRRGHFELTSGPGFRALRLPYSGGRTSMLVILPDRETAELPARLDERELHRIIAALHGRPREVLLDLPRFKARFGADLVGPLQRLGIQRAFDLRLADFSGITGRPTAEYPLAIGTIKHRAVIDVNEQGTEAAAATGMGMVTTSIRPQPETFTVDRPFVFVVVDDVTGVVLFEGRIADPGQAS